MVRYRAYFDESITPRDFVIESFTVAGAVSSLDRWTKLSSEWRRVLDDPEFGLGKGAVFHMTDVLAGLTRGVGHFKKLKGKYRTVRNLLQRLSGITRARVIHGFSFTLDQRDYDAVNFRYQLTESFGGAYDLCMLQCAHFLRKWANRHEHPLEEIDFVIEQRPKGIGQLTDRMRRYGFWAPSPKNKQEEALQACDLMAWQFNNALKLAYAGTTIRALEPAMESIGRIAGDYHIQESQQQIETNCIAIGVPPRA